jgi:hypothetical protein
VHKVMVVVMGVVGEGGGQSTRSIETKRFVFGQ